MISLESWGGGGIEADWESDAVGDGRNDTAGLPLRRLDFECSDCGASGSNSDRVIDDMASILRRIEKAKQLAMSFSTDSNPRPLRTCASPSLYL